MATATKPQPQASEPKAKSAPKIPTFSETKPVPEGASFEDTELFAGPKNARRSLGKAPVLRFSSLDAAKNYLGEDKFNRLALEGIHRPLHKRAQTLHAMGADAETIRQAQIQARLGVKGSGGGRTGAPTKALSEAVKSGKISRGTSEKFFDLVNSGQLSEERIQAIMAAVEKQNAASGATQPSA